MESLGAYLKKERESKGVTLEEISNSTHISKKFLKAIELDDFAGLPNQTIARGFVRAYAKCICIDPNEVMNAYNELMQEFDQNKAPINVIRLKEKSKIKPVVVGLILTVIFIYIYFSLTNHPVEKMTGTATGPVKVPPKENNFSQEVQNMSVNKVPEATIIDQKPSEPDVVIDQVEQKIEQARPEIIPSKASGGELSLTIVAKEDAWLNIIIDDVEIKDVILHPGEKIKWNAKRSFLFSSGNKRGLDVFFQGNLVTFPEPQNRIVKNFMIDRSLLNKEMPIQTQ